MSVNDKVYEKRHRIVLLIKFITTLDTIVY